MRIVGGELRGRRLAIPADPRGATDRRAGARGVDEYSPRRLCPVPGCWISTQGVVLWAWRRFPGGRQRGVRGSWQLLPLRPSRPTSRPWDSGARASVHRGDDFGSPRGSRLPATTWHSRTQYTRDDAVRLVALFRQAPFARILAVEHPGRTELAGDETRRYGDTSITFCYQP